VAWLRTLADGTWPLEQVIDPTRGVLVVHYEDYDGDAHPVQSARRYCGAALTEQLPQLRRELEAALEYMECRDWPAPVCESPGEENIPRFTYSFVRGSEGLVLDVISAISWNATSDDFKQQATAFVDRARAAPANCR
jgi:hypothetical protein